MPESSRGLESLVLIKSTVNQPSSCMSSEGKVLATHEFSTVCWSFKGTPNMEKGNWTHYAFSTLATKKAT